MYLYIERRVKKVQKVRRKFKKQYYRRWKKRVAAKSKLLNWKLKNKQSKLKKKIFFLGRSLSIRADRLFVKKFDFKKLFLLSYLPALHRPFVKAFLFFPRSFLAGYVKKCFKNSYAPVGGVARAKKANLWVRCSFRKKIKRRGLKKHKKKKFFSSELIKKFRRKSSRQFAQKRFLRRRFR